MRPISGDLRGIISATITAIALTMDWTKTRREGDRHRSGIPVSDSHHILVWEVSTIAIPGQRLLERCECILATYRWVRRYSGAPGCLANRQRRTVCSSLWGRLSHNRTFVLWTVPPFGCAPGDCRLRLPQKPALEIGGDH